MSRGNDPKGGAIGHGSTQLPWSIQIRRIPRLIGGLIVFGFGIGLFFLGNNGVPGWDVFHQGVSERTGLSVGSVMISIGILLVVLMLMLREPIGVGTVAAAIITGLIVDTTLWLIDEPTNWMCRALMTLFGPVFVGIGSGLYLGVRLGAGPRDGLMTALNRRGFSLWKARIGIEASALLVGLAFGGTVGWGTVWFAVTVGPAVQISLKYLSLPMHPAERLSSDHR